MEEIIASLSSYRKDSPFQAMAVGKFIKMHDDSDKGFFQWLEFLEVVKKRKKWNKRRMARYMEMTDVKRWKTQWDGMSIHCDLILKHPGLVILQWLKKDSPEIFCKCQKSVSENVIFYIYIRPEKKSTKKNRRRRK